MILDPLKVARYVYLGMSQLHQTKRDMLFMSPREFFALWDEHLEYHGQKPKDRVASIDDLP